MTMVNEYETTMEMITWLRKQKVAQFKCAAFDVTFSGHAFIEDFIAPQPLPEESAEALKLKEEADLYYSAGG